MCERREASKSGVTVSGVQGEPPLPKGQCSVHLTFSWTSDTVSRFRSPYGTVSSDTIAKPNEGPKSINTQFANAKPSAESETSATGASTKRVAGRRVTRIPLASERRKHFTRGGGGRGSRLSAESQQSSRASGAGKSKVGAQNSQCTAPTGQRSSVAHQPIDPHASTGTNSKQHGTDARHTTLTLQAPVTGSCPVIGPTRPITKRRTMRS
jgi:hypothetical protein